MEYEGRYEINEKAVVKRRNGVDGDGRKVSARAAAASRAQNGIIEEKSFGNGASKTRLLSSKGWFRNNFQAWRAALVKGTGA